MSTRKSPARYRTIIAHRRIGRWTVMLGKQYLGEMYGQLCSDSWEYTATITRNPK